MLMSAVASVPNDDRKRVAKELGRVLADSYTLMLKTQGFHWNVTGPQFNGLHAMFEQQYQELFTAVDEIAERIRALGEPAPAGFRAYQELSTLEDGADVADAKEMVRVLAADHETLSRSADKARKVAEDAGDEVSLDMMVGRMTEHDKTAWMLNAAAA
jgi:starvation-inducible DNA-binding protein